MVDGRIGDRLTFKTVADVSPSSKPMHAEPRCAVRLREAVRRAEPMLRAISEDMSARPPAPGKWSPRQIIGHLIDSASNNHQRFVRAAWKDDLIFPGYEQEQWVELQRYQTQPWSELLTFWSAYNRHLAVLMAAVPLEARTRIHERHNLDEIATRAPTKRTEQTLDYFMSDYVDHLELHMQQILGREWPAAEPVAAAA